MVNARKVVAILQARMGSTRLPGKVLQNILGIPMLSVIIQRISDSKMIDQFVVATTRLKQDEAIEKLANEHNIKCFRGAENDCLNRYYHAAKKYEADIIIRLTGDNPFVDSHFIDWALNCYLDKEVLPDYVESSSSKTFPIGLSVEIFPYSLLSYVYHTDKNEQWREHVLAYVLKNRKKFTILPLKYEKNCSHLRLTVDTLDDMRLARRIFASQNNINFNWMDAIQVLNMNPDWIEINKGVLQRTI